MNSADHALLAQSFDRKSQARINRLSPQGFAREPASEAAARLLVPAPRRLTWADACPFGEAEVEVVS